MEFQREILTKELFEEILPLAKNHWAETRPFPDLEFYPAEEAYLFAEEIGALRVYTARARLWIGPDNAREEKPTLMGYAASVVQASMNTGLLEANQIAIYILPAYRGFGPEFISWYTKALQEEDVKLLHHHASMDGPYGKILAKQGHEPVETEWLIRLNP